MESRRQMLHLSLVLAQGQGSRQSQQDALGYRCREGETLAVVADGMGGLPDGAEAAQLALQTFLQGFMKQSADQPMEGRLLFLAEEANRQLARWFGEGKSGATLAAAAVREDRLFFLSVGDSLVLLLRGGALIPLTREHVLQRDLELGIARGDLPSGFACPSEQSAALTSFVGMGDLKRIDRPARPLRLLPGDRVALMTDGLHKVLDEEELTALCALRDIDQVASALQRSVRAKRHPDQDNYSLILLECGLTG